MVQIASNCSPLFLFVLGRSQTVLECFGVFQVAHGLLIGIVSNCFTFASFCFMWFRLLMLFRVVSDRFSFGFSCC